MAKLSINKNWAGFKRRSPVKKALIIIVIIFAVIGFVSSAITAYNFVFPTPVILAKEPVEYNLCFWKSELTIDNDLLTHPYITLILKKTGNATEEDPKVWYKFGDITENNCGVGETNFSEDYVLATTVLISESDPQAQQSDAIGILSCTLEADDALFYIQFLKELNKLGQSIELPERHGCMLKQNIYFKVTWGTNQENDFGLNAPIWVYNN